MSNPNSSDDDYEKLENFTNSKNNDFKVDQGTLEMLTGRFDKDKLIKEEENIRVQESQVQDIIKMIKDEFDLNENNDPDDFISTDANTNTEKEEKMSEKSRSSRDTGFEEKNQNEGSVETNDENDTKERVEDGFKKEEYIENDFQSYDQNNEEAEYESEDEEDNFLRPDDMDFNAYSDLIDFIEKAKQFDVNALDLSRKNLSKIPKSLLEFRNLQYLYLEGNQISKLPRNFFSRFPNLKWLDLRNNLLTDLPTKGLEKHEFLKYLLLENNKIRILPFEISTLRNLTALNINNNPVEYPPLEIIKKGCKQLQEYMKDDIKRNNIDISISQSDRDENFDLANFNEDVWASEDEDRAPRRSSSSTAKNRPSKSATKYGLAPTDFIGANIEYLKIRDSRVKSVTRNLLVTRPIGSGESVDPNYLLKERLNKAKINANKISKNAMKLLNKRKLLPPIGVYKNEDYEKAVRTGKVDKYKKSKEKIDEKLQKVKDKTVTDKFKDDLKVQQRKMYGKRLEKGVDYIEPVHKAPFDISEDHLMVMTNEEREYLDRKLAIERIRSLSPETLWRIEEERRLRDNMLQDKIREYTNKLLNRRNNRSENPKYDRMQAARDIRELKLIERELEQRRLEMQYNLRTYTGDLLYRETAKLNAKSTVSNVLKSSQMK